MCFHDMREEATAAHYLDEVDALEDVDIDDDVDNELKVE